MRCFVALPLSNKIVNGLNEIQNGLSKSGFKLRWVKPENIHLTIAFMGEITQEQVDKIGIGLEEIAKDFQPFEIVIGKLGAFASPKNARVVWVGCREENGLLRNLQKAVVKMIKAENIPLESKKFHPHLTLGRANPPIKKLAVPENIWNCSPGILNVTEINIYQSNLSSDGASYSILKSVPIK